MKRTHNTGFGVGFWLCGTWLAGLVFCAITASWLPVDPNRFDSSQSLRPPSWRHPFGTTRLGEDIFAICVHGTRVALIVAFGTVTIALAIGGPLGMAAGYFRGGFDRVVGIVLDAAMAVPVIIFALALVLYVGQKLSTVVLIIGVLFAPRFARIARSATLAVADREYVTAARMTGAGTRRILLREVGPNVAIVLGSYLLLLAGIAILVEGGLSFIGLGAPLEKASWGRLVAGGRDELQHAWWWSMCPSAVFFLTSLSLNLVSDRLQARRLGLSRPRVRLGRNQPHRTDGWREVVAVEPLRVNGAGPSRHRAPEPAAGGREVVLDVVDLRVSISSPFGLVRAVDGVNVRIERGAMLAIVGESGAGKTMLARSILGVAPAHAETSGRVVLDGCDLRSLSSSQLRQRRGRDIAIVLQDPATSLNPVMRVGWQVAETARVHLGLTKREAKTHALELLTAVGMTDPERRFRQYPHELSGGLRQRVAIAYALSCSPKLLIADEPTSSLDVVIQAQILDLLDRLRRERQLAVLLITHDLRVAMARADEIAVMYAGRVVERATPTQLRTALRMPYTAALFASAPRLADPAHQRPVAIPGRPPLLGVELPGCAFAPRCGQSGPRCSSERPLLDEVASGHLVACWFPVDRARPAAPNRAATNSPEVEAGRDLCA